MARLAARRAICGCLPRERSDAALRFYGGCSASSGLKVAVLGAAGKTGKILSLCLKQSPIIDELAIYDSYPARGLLLELAHFNTSCRTFCHGDGDDASGRLGLERALRSASVVAVVEERMTEDVYGEAQRLQALVPSIVRHCPKALVALVSRSVNALLPMTFELYKRCGGFGSCERLFGVLNLYSTRANTFAAEALNVAPEFVSVPVIGGGCARTCVPLFSRTRPCADFTSEELSRLTQSMRSVDERVNEAYLSSHAPSESSAVCMGYAAARFCLSLCKALRGERGVHECAYVRSCLVPELKYFGAPVELGPSGVQRHLGIPKLTGQECDALHDAVGLIKRQIALGESLALCSKRSSSEVCPIPARCSALQVHR